jgi:hypothetical protein
MTANSKNPHEELNKIAKLYINELLGMSDSDLLEEAKNSEWLTSSAISAKEAYERAVKSVGSAKLLKARKDLEAKNNETANLKHSIDAQTAHKIIAKLRAANDSKFTLAARNLKELSDKEALDLVNELIELGAVPMDESP